MKKIVLTGGPCGGKSTAIVKVREYYQDRGIRVITVPELATLIGTNGFDIGKLVNTDILAFEQILLETQIVIEDKFIKLASIDDTESIIIFDRGALDIKAYINKDIWDAIINISDYSEVELRDKRYDAVIHLTTAANGAEDFYTLSNNEVRSESPQQAIQIDEKIISVWTGQPHFRIIDNSTSFEGKMEKVIKEINSIIGIPHPIEYERKFVVGNYSIPKQTPLSEIEITQNYLVAYENSTEERIRKRGQNQNYTYYHTKKIKNGKARTEIERQISPEEYLNLLAQRDPEISEIKKLRKCFVYKSQYFELDIFENLKTDLVILEIELENENSKYEIPDYVQIKEEVTNNDKYKNKEIAKRLSLTLDMT